MLYIPLIPIILALGLGLIFLGFILIVIDFFHSSTLSREELEEIYRRVEREKVEHEKEEGEDKEKKRRARAEGIVFIGPFPIVISGSSRLAEIIIIASLVIFFIIVILFLFWAFYPPVILVPAHPVHAVRSF